MPFSRYSTSVKWVLTPNHPRSHFRPVLEWHRPIHVYRRWLQTVLPSPRRLGLYLLYTRGTLVRKNLRRWPVFPIISDYVRHLRYNYNTLSPKDEDDNIVAALEHPDRVTLSQASGNESAIGNSGHCGAGGVPGAITALVSFERR